MTIAGKFFDLSDCCIVYPGFMMHVSNSDWTRTKNNGFMPFVPHQTQEHVLRSKRKRIHKFSRTLCRHVHQLDVYKKLRRSFKITQSFVDNAPTDTNSI